MKIHALCDLIGVLHFIDAGKTSDIRAPKGPRRGHALQISLGRSKRYTDGLLRGDPREPGSILAEHRERTRYLSAGKLSRSPLLLVRIQSVRLSIASGEIVEDWRYPRAS